MWRAARASIGFMNKAARDIVEEYARNATGKLATTPRWKTCVGSAAGSFAAAVGKMFVTKHFKEDAKCFDYGRNFEDSKQSLFVKVEQKC